MPESLQKFLESDNIAEMLSKDELAKIGAQVADGYDNDRNDRKPWEDKMKEAMDLALQNTKRKTFPWKNASNVMMPIITEAIVQYSSRMYPALIPPVDIVKARTVGSDPDGQKQNAAIRVSKHMSYQLLEESDDWEEEMDRGMIVQPLLGNMYKKTYYDEGLGRNVSDMLSPNEFVMCNNAKSVASSFRKTHYFDSTANDIKVQMLMGQYITVDLEKPEKEDSDKPESQQTSESDESTPYRILEQHTWLDLDNDGLLEPYIVTVEHKSRMTLKIVCGYTEADAMYQGDVLVEVRQVQYFTKYGFIPNPDGSIMDLGLGQLLCPLNKQINTNINQLNDSGTLSITGGGLLGRGIKIKGGEIKRKMGQYVSVPTSGQDLARNIVHFPEVKPSPVLFQLLGMMMTSAQRIASTLDSQVGENPGQNQKATTTMAVQEEGKRIFSGIYKRCHRSLKKEMKRWYYLNSVHLPWQQYLNILDGVPEEQREQVGEQLFRTDYNLEAVDIIPAADSQYTSSQMKMAKAQSLMDKLQTGLVNPQVAMKRALEAEEQPAIEEIMTMPEQQPPFEVTKFEAEMKLEYAKLLLETMGKEQDMINNEILVKSQVLLNIAKAEGEEVGAQINEYRAELDTLSAMAKQNLENMKQEQQKAMAPPQEGQKPPQ